jgi:basic amino acid/polyamine antiporter, APA family
VGGTVGSGVFVLAGEIANAESLPAGPAVTLAFLFAGVGCALSGLSFAELASRIHQDGSSYAYAYVTLGEVFAFVAGCCLTLEYGVSSAAVARNWGDKLGAWIAHLKGEGDAQGLPASLWRPAADGVNLYAGMIEAACLLVMLRGLSLSKLTVDVFTVAKLLLVVGMTAGGFLLYRPAHMKPFAPSGFRGVFRGSMRCFFGYLGACVLGGREGVCVCGGVCGLLLLLLLVVAYRWN